MCVLRSGPRLRPYAAIAVGAFMVALGAPALRAPLAATPATGEASAATADVSAPEGRWCAPELESLPGDVCFSLPSPTGPPPRELAIFLHGVIAPGGTWQWAQQRGAARAGTIHGLAVLMPPGRQHLRTDSMRDWFTWPTSAAAQQRAEHEVLAQWLAAREALEARLGQPFERTYLVGFSNGAYHVSSLALRGRLPIDGYAAFAGGIAPGPLRPKAYAALPRVPFYVGYGGADGAARRDCETFRPFFRAARWPGKVVGTKGVGHEVTDAQWRAAIEHFRTANAERQERDR